MAEESVLDRMRRVEEPPEESDQGSGSLPLLGELTQKVAPMVGETVGATGGTAIGTAAGGLPGAIIGGAAGARMGRAGGVALTGRPLREGELTGAGLVGAAGPAFASLSRPIVRIFTGIPSLRAAREAARVATDRAEAQLSHSSIQRVANRAAARMEGEIVKRVNEINQIKLMSPDDIIEKYGSQMAADKRVRELAVEMSSEALTRYQGIIPKELRKAFVQPEISVARSALMMQLPEAAPGGVGAALGALLSHDPLSGGAVGGAIGYLFGRAGKKVGVRLVRNERFRNWVTGVSPRSPIAQAGITFVTEVMLTSRTAQEAKDAKQFFDLMMDLIEEAPEFALGVLEPESIETSTETTLPSGERLPPGTTFTPRRAFE